LQEEELAGKQSDRALKEAYGKRLLRGLFLQIAFADVVFLVYAQRGVDWHIDRYVMSVWLTATVVEVIGVVAIVTKSLFPSN
jgi:hypothetical protein